MVKPVNYPYIRGSLFLGAIARSGLERCDRFWDWEKIGRRKSTVSLSKTKNPHHLAKVGHQGASTFLLFVTCVGCSGRSDRCPRDLVD
jgi:hypothetical protein